MRRIVEALASLWRGLVAPPAPQPALLPVRADVPALRRRQRP